ncbi:MAG: phage baseplate assembly protein V [Deltaproteobacteria bacterium]|nr:phage baseplate assembly protein V [Deltaproteobacteria bacterium]
MIKALKNLRRRLSLMVSRGVVKLVDDSLKMQGMQLTLLAGEVAEAERFQQYGFTSVPLDGAEVIALAVGGNRGHMVVIAADDRRYRPTGLEPGDVAAYNSSGALVLLTGGQVKIGAGDQPQVLGSGLKTCLEKMVDEMILLSSAPTTMGKVLAPTTTLEALKTALADNAGDGEIRSENNFTGK